MCFIDSSVVSSVFRLNRYKSLSVVTCYEEFRTFTSPTIINIYWWHSLQSLWLRYKLASPILCIYVALLTYLLLEVGPRSWASLIDSRSSPLMRMCFAAYPLHHMPLFLNIIMFKQHCLCFSLYLLLKVCPICLSNVIS